MGSLDNTLVFFKEAFVYVTHKGKTKLKFNKNRTLVQVNQVKFTAGPDRDYYLNNMHFVNESVSTEGYSKRLERHRGYYSE